MTLMQSCLKFKTMKVLGTSYTLQVVIILQNETLLTLVMRQLLRRVILINLLIQ